MKQIAKLMCGIAAALVFTAVQASAQFSLTGTTYTENFDTLGTSTVAGASVLPTGWFAFASGAANATNGVFTPYTTVLLGTGTATTGTNYNFGIAGANPITDRALGSIASGTGNTRFMEFRFVNDTGLEIIALTISYDGEQWRNGGNTATHELSLHYSTDGSTFTATEFDFLSPTVGATAAALDGNVASNRVAGIGGTFAVSIPTETTFYLRWVDINDVGSDHALAIDNFSLTATLIPEPSTLLLVGLGLFGAFMIRRYRS